MKRCIAVCTLVFALFLPQTAFAWNYTGHEVVARIAWEKMKPQTRSRIIDLLMQAPPDADLASQLPTDGRPLSNRQRDLFMLASVWPDIVRSDEFPERKQKYHRSIWHYTNFFWKMENGTPVDVVELQPERINIVERLNFLRTEVAEPKLPAGKLGIDVAWILHLVGDVHQPLHTSARVTETELKGDQGGNLFFLTPKDTPPKDSKRLHGYWDDILNTSIPRKKDETAIAYANRIATMIMKRQPGSKFKTRLKNGRFADWAKEGLTSAKKSAYPSWLIPYQAPSDKYRKQAYSIAEPAIALAGYRLAALLDDLFGK